MTPVAHSPRSVLIVDDDPIAGELLANLLRTGGFQVVPAATGSAGLLTLCRHQAAIEWLVAKVKLPGLIDGWMLADEYHRHHGDRPTVLLFGGETEGADCPAIDAVFIPPVSPMRVLETLKALSEPRYKPAPFRPSQAA
jgi:CheY-like chemotaxis protein